MCKKERDAIIYERIMLWEKEKYSKMQSEDEKRAYIESLEEQRKDIARQFEKIPPSIGNKHKRWRMAADIEQLKWRMGYLGV